jgi:hypothetical protein
LSGRINGSTLDLMDVLNRSFNLRQGFSFAPVAGSAR